MSGLCHVSQCLCSCHCLCRQCGHVRVCHVSQCLCSCHCLCRQCGHVRVVSCQSVLVLMPQLVSPVWSCQGCVMSVSACAHATACVLPVWSCQGVHVSQCLCSCHCLCRQCGHVRVVSCQSVLVLMPLLVSCQIAIAINDSSKLGIKKRIKSVRSCQGCVMSVPTLTSVQVNVTACVMSEWSCQGCVLSCPCKGLVLKAVSFVLCGYTASELCNGLC